LLLVAGASALAACASHGPVPVATTNGTGTAQVASATAPDAGKPVPKGYRLVVKKGTEYYCRMQPVTGSHTLKTEVCLTEDQLEAEKHQGLALEAGPTNPAQVGR
jgi:hypothetical protein